MPLGITNCESILSRCIAVIGGFTNPLHCFGIILFDTFSHVITIAEIELRICPTLFCGFAIPFNRFSVILFDPQTVFVTIPKIMLAFGIPLFSSFAIPLERFCVILLDADTVAITIPQFALRHGIALFSRLAIVFNLRVSADHTDCKRKTNNRNDHFFHFSPSIQIDLKYHMSSSAPFASACSCSRHAKSKIALSTPMGI